MEFGLFIEDDEDWGRFGDGVYQFKEVLDKLILQIKDQLLG